MDEKKKSSFTFFFIFYSWCYDTVPTNVSKKGGVTGKDGVEQLKPTRDITLHFEVRDTKAPPASIYHPKCVKKREKIRSMV